MDNTIRQIDDIKYQVKQLIQENLYREVTPETKHNSSGIYMIYIDNFTSEKIVPIYIGQSKDIQRRYKDHFCEILALNRLSYDEYNNYFFSRSRSFYEGKFKSCKIFKYMIENKCKLQDFHMILLEETDIEELEEKEQMYIQRLLSSFFGFNQLNSFLSYKNLLHSNDPISDLELDHFLRLVQKDMNGIYSYYDYGFTRFNFEHAFPKDFSFLLKEKNKLKEGTLLKCDERKSNIDKLLKYYQIDIQVGEIKRLKDSQEKLDELYKASSDEYDEALTLLRSQVMKKFKNLRLYSNKAIQNFIYSIFSNEKNKYKEQFLKYLHSKQCELNFYETFDKQIKNVDEKILKMTNIKNCLDDAFFLVQKKEIEIRQKRYKMIFPSSQFKPFSLGDRSNHLPIKINENNDLFNTCHIKIYISNNGLSRSYYRKDPFIIRFDYCYIDHEGRRLEKQYYIENKATKNCKLGIDYFEKDFYDRFSFNKTKFSISSLIDNELDNSFISVLAEFKHGINDCTIKEKKLVRLSNILNELQELVDDETGFSIDHTESNKSLEICMINEKIRNHSFVEKLVKKKLPKIKKDRTAFKTKSKNVADKSRNSKENKANLKVDNTVKRAEAYKHKVLIRTNNEIDILNYISSKEKVTAKCKICRHVWKIRSDHLLAKPYCPLCEKITKNNKF